MKKTLSLLLSVVIVLTACLGFGSTAFADSSFVCGNGVYATFDASNQTLYINSSNQDATATYDYTPTTAPDWTAIDGINDLTDIKHIDVSESITYIGRSLFLACVYTDDIIIRNYACRIADDNSININIKIYGRDDGSTAIMYAKSYNRQYGYLYYVVFKDINGELLSATLYKSGTKKEEIIVPETPPAKPHPMPGRHIEYRFRLEGSNYSGIYDVGEKDVTYQEKETLVECTMIRETVQPTCTQAGSIRVYCSQCGYESETRELPAHHSYQTVNETDSSCVVHGTYTLKCTACAEEKTFEKPLKDHEPVIETVPATCQHGSYDVEVCQVCGEILVEYDENNDKADHMLKTVIDQQDATCEERGYIDRECVVCGETQREYTAEAKGHILTVKKNSTTNTHDLVCEREGCDYVEEGVDCSFTGRVTKAPTKTEEGEMTYTCECSNSYTSTIDKVDCDHLANDVRIEGARVESCTQKGYTGDTYCNECNTLIAGGTDIPMSEHQYDTVTAEIPPSCENQGKTALEACRACGFERGGEVIPALNHDYEKEVTDPTCSKGGFTTFTCKMCHDQYVGDYTDKTNDHDFVTTTQEVKPTCTEKGFSEVKTCRTCGVIVGGEEMSETGHDFGMNEPVCKVCGAENPSYIKPICQHTKTEIRGYQDPTCTENGYTGDTYCIDCNQRVRIGDKIDKLGHDFGTYVSNNNASCRADGTKTSTCSRCGATNTVVDNGTKTPHTYAAEVVAPKCGEYGYTINTCTFCGYSYNSDYTKPVGHRYVNGVCTVCGAVDKLAEIIDTPTTTQPTTQPTTQAPTTTTTTAASSATKKPKSTSIKKLTKGKKSFKATWKKITGVSGYQVQYATDKKFKKNTKTVTIKKNTTSATIKKLKANKKYYVRVRTYKNVKVNGKTNKVYSSWSKVKSVKTK